MSKHDAHRRSIRDQLGDMIEDAAEQELEDRAHQEELDRLDREYQEEWEREQANPPRVGRHGYPEGDWRNESAEVLLSDWDDWDHERDLYAAHLARRAQMEPKHYTAIELWKYKRYQGLLRCVGECMGTPVTDSDVHFVIAEGWSWGDSYIWILRTLDGRTIMLEQEDVPHRGSVLIHQLLAPDLSTLLRQIAGEHLQQLELEHVPEEALQMAEIDPNGVQVATDWLLEQGLPVPKCFQKKTP